MIVIIIEVLNEGTFYGYNLLYKKKRRVRVTSKPYTGVRTLVAPSNT